MISTNNVAVITQVQRQYIRDNAALMQQLIQLRYWNRGALTMDDVYSMSSAERDIEIDFINQRFKDAAEFARKTKTNPQPFL